MATHFNFMSILTQAGCIPFGLSAEILYSISWYQNHFLTDFRSLCFTFVHLSCLVSVVSGSAAVSCTAIFCTAISRFRFYTLVFFSRLYVLTPPVFFKQSFYPSTGVIFWFANWLVVSVCLCLALVLSVSLSKEIVSLSLSLFESLWVCARTEVVCVPPTSSSLGSLKLVAQALHKSSVCLSRYVLCLSFPRDFP